MHPTIILYKPQGISPLDAVKILQQKYPEYKDEKIGYAGRLDPMAEGLLLLLVGEENKKRKEYERLSKIYDVEIVIGVATDSYDALGKITNISQTMKHCSKKEIEQVPGSLTGEIEQPYPPYSAARVNGKPLYYWAREGKIDSIKIPTKKIIISKIDLVSIGVVPAKTLEQIISEKISRITGNFRQEEIKDIWKKYFQENQQEYQMIKIHVECSSGTYMRGLANMFGKKIKSNAFALSILRTQIGNFDIKGATHI